MDYIVSQIESVEEKPAAELFCNHQIYINGNQVHLFDASVTGSLKIPDSIHLLPSYHLCKLTAKNS